MDKFECKFEHIFVDFLANLNLEKPNEEKKIRLILNQAEEW